RFSRDWSSDVCSSDLRASCQGGHRAADPPEPDRLLPAIGRPRQSGRTDRAAGDPDKLLFRFLAPESVFHEISLDKFIQIPVHHALHIGSFHACPQIFYQLIGMEYLVSDLG